MLTNLLLFRSWISAHKRQLWLYGLPTFISLHAAWHGEWRQTLLALGFMLVVKSLPLLEPFRQRGERILKKKED